MPTIITHALVGSSLGVLTPKNVSTIRLVVVLAVLSVIPDLDVVGFEFGITYGHPLGHRGFSHSLLFALFLAIVVSLLLFRSTEVFSKTWWGVVALCFVATASHGVLDALTDAGLGIGFFIPFDDTRYFFPWRPIETSPLSISSFLNGPAVKILKNELLWIGVPLAVGLAVFALVRRYRAKNT